MVLAAQRHHRMDDIASRRLVRAGNKTVTVGSSRSKQVERHETLSARARLRQLRDDFGDTARAAGMTGCIGESGSFCGIENQQ